MLNGLQLPNGGGKFVATAWNGTEKAYDSADGTEMTTIDQAFKQGNKVVGKGTQQTTRLQTKRLRTQPKPTNFTTTRLYTGQDDRQHQALTGRSERQGHDHYCGIDAYVAKTDCLV